MMGRLVVMLILTHFDFLELAYFVPDAGDYLLHAFHAVVKQLVQLGRQRFSAAVKVHKALPVKDRRECVDPTHRFGVVALGTAPLCRVIVLGRRRKDAVL